MAVIDLAKYVAPIDIDLSDFNSKFDKVDSDIKSKVAGLANGMKTGLLVGVGAITTAVTSMTALATSAGETAKEIDKFSQVTGTSTKGYQELDYMMKSVGYSMESASGDFAALAEKALDAKNATGEGAEIFGKLGIAVTDTSGKMKTQEEIFNETITALQGMEDVTERNAIASALLGTTGEELVPILNMTAQEVENMKTKANELGLVMDDASINAGKNFASSLGDIKASFEGVVQKIGIEVMPLIQTFLDWVISNMPTIQNVISTVFEVAGDVINVFVEVVKWLTENISEFVEDNKTSFEAVADTISTVFDGIMEFIKGFIELFKTVWDKYGKDIVSFITNNLNNVKAVFEGVFQTIKGIVDFFISAFKGDWDGMGKALKTITEGLWDTIISLFKTTVDNIGGILKGAISIFSGIAKGIMEGIWNAFKNVWSSITSWVSTSFTNIASTISGFGSKLYNAGKDIFNDLLDGLKDVWKNISSFVSDKVEWITDKLSFWKKSEKEMDGGSASTSKPKSTKSSYNSYAVGTPFVPNDQLAYIHQGEAIIPKEFNPYAGGKGLGGGNNFNSQYDITLKVDGNLDRSILPEVERMIRSAIDRSDQQAMKELNKSGIFRKIKL